MQKKDLSKIKWGEIYTCDLGNMKGSVQCGVRPVLVVQTNKLNSNSPTVVVAVITSARKREDKVFLPKTVAEMLKERYQEIQEYKELFGDEFQDFNLVFCNANGRPMESQIITRALQKLIKDNDLPPVVFHSLRHSSITYKLKLNGGDIKSVQGDSGHAQVKMVTDVYSHIIDEDRRLNAQRFEETFYQKKNPSEVNGATVEPKKEPQGITEEAMLNYMVQNPDFLQKFKVLLGVGN